MCTYHSPNQTTAGDCVHHSPFALRPPCRPTLRNFPHRRLTRTPAAAICTRSTVTSPQPPSNKGSMHRTTRTPTPLLPPWAPPRPRISPLPRPTAAAPNQPQGLMASGSKATQAPAHTSTPVLSSARCMRACHTDTVPGIPQVHTPAHVHSGGCSQTTAGIEVATVGDLESTATNLQHRPEEVHLVGMLGCTKRPAGGDKVAQGRNGNPNGWMPRGLYVWPLYFARVVSIWGCSPKIYMGV